MEKSEEVFCESTAGDQACQVILHLVRQRSRESRLTYVHDFENALSEHGLLKSPDTEERQSEFESLFILAREMSPEIRTVNAGKQRVGYYSEQYICEMLAMLLAWKEQDPLVLMAEIVRFNSFHNPRLTVKSLFMRLPFQLSSKEVEANLETMKGQEAFEDIVMIVTPAGTEFLYSTRYLNPDQAARLAELCDLSQTY
jgi:hypothetical protein